MEEQSEQWWKYYGDRDDSIITDLFSGQLMSSIQCKHCNKKSLAFDNFMDLSVPIPRSGVRITGNVELDQCIKAFINPEKMEECGYKCTGCKNIDNFEKQMTIFRFPQILVIHLKRFYNSYMRREKLNTTIRIPLTLDMSNYAPHSSKLILCYIIL